MKGSKGLSVSNAMGAVCHSETCRTLVNEATGLYRESSAYAYELLKQELRQKGAPSNSAEATEKYLPDEAVAYIVFIVREFAAEYGLTRREAFDYLNDFKGIAFLEESYRFEHTQSPHWTVKNLPELCRHNGRLLAPKG
jgi:hypothetical protein